MGFSPPSPGLGGRDLPRPSCRAPVDRPDPPLQAPARDLRNVLAALLPGGGGDRLPDEPRASLHLRQAATRRVAGPGGHPPDSLPRPFLGRPPVSVPDWVLRIDGLRARRAALPGSPQPDARRRRHRPARRGTALLGRGTAL